MNSWKVKQLFDSWKKITGKSTNRQIFSVALLVGILTVLVKLVAIGKELVIAWRFGTEDTLDAFLIAFTIPSFLATVVAGPLSNAFIPAYIRVKEHKGRETAQKLFAGTLFYGFALLAAITIITAIAAPLYLPLIASGFSAKKLEISFHLLRATAPFILFSGISTILSAVLNAEERFTTAALAPILTATTCIFFLLVFPAWGVFGLAAGLISGAVLEIVLLGVTLYRQRISFHLKKLYSFDAHLRELASQYVPMVAAALLICSAIPVDQSMAAMLLPGSISALNYGNRVTLSILTLIATALNTAVMPYFSKMLAGGDWAGISNTYKRYIQLILSVTIPLAGLFTVFSEPLIQLLYQRGSFTSEDTRIVAQIQAFYALGIPFYLGDILAVALIKALGISHVLIWISGINLLLNIILNYIFLQWMGVKGIALSTSFVYLFSFLVLLFFTQKRLKIISNSTN